MKYFFIPDGFTEKAEFDLSLLTPNPITGRFFDCQIHNQLGKTLKMRFGNKVFLLKSAAWAEDDSGKVLWYFPLVIGEVLAPPCERC